MRLFALFGLGLASLFHDLGWRIEVVGAGATRRYPFVEMLNHHADVFYIGVDLELALAAEGALPHLSRSANASSSARANAAGGHFLGVTYLCCFMPVNVLRPNQRGLHVESMERQFTLMQSLFMPPRI